MFRWGLVQTDFTIIIQGYITGHRAIIRLVQWQQSNPQEYGEIDHMNYQELITLP